MPTTRSRKCAVASSSPADPAPPPASTPSNSANSVKGSWGALPVEVREMVVACCAEPRPGVLEDRDLPTLQRLSKVDNELRRLATPLIWENIDFLQSSTTSIFLTSARLDAPSVRSLTFKIGSGADLHGISEENRNGMLDMCKTVGGSAMGNGDRQKQDQRIHDIYQLLVLIQCKHLKKVHYINDGGGRFSSVDRLVWAALHVHSRSASSPPEITLSLFPRRPFAFLVTFLDPCPPVKHLKINASLEGQTGVHPTPFYEQLREMEGLDSLELYGNELLQLPFFTLPTPFASALTSLRLVDEEPLAPTPFSVIKPFLESLSTSLTHLTIGIDLSDVPPPTSKPSIDLPLLTHLSYDWAWDRFDLFPSSPLSHISHLCLGDSLTIDDILPAFDTHSTTLEAVTVGWAARYDPERYGYTSARKEATLPGLKEACLVRLKERCAETGVRLVLERPKGIEGFLYRGGRSASRFPLFPLV